MRLFSLHPVSLSYVFILTTGLLNRQVHSTIVVHFQYVDAILVKLLAVCDFVNHTSHNVTLSIFN